MQRFGASSEKLPFQGDFFDEAELDELARSITQHGIVQPVVVRSMPEGRYEIIAGERRWRACHAAAESNGGPDKAVIPAMIQEMDDDLALEIQTIENLLQRGLLSRFGPLFDAERLGGEVTLAALEVPANHMFRRCSRR